MKKRHSEIVKELKPSGIRKFFDLVMNTPDIISLGVGEPDFPTPWRIREHAIYTLEKGVTSYTSNYGLTELRKLITKYLYNRYNCNYDIENVLITVGVSEAVDIVMRSICNPGDEIIIPEPCYVSYYPMVKLAGANPVIVKSNAKNKFHIDINNIKKSITRNTKAIIINYPNNPTGATLNKKEIEDLINLAVKEDFYILSDEIYAELTYDTQHISMGSYVNAKNNVILLSGFSKAWAMTGWRIGYICAAKDVVDAALKVHQYSMLCAPVMGQFAAIEALNNGASEVADMVEEYRRRRDFIYQGLNSIGLKTYMPEGAFYIFPSIKSTGLKSEEFALKLLQKEKVAVVPGTAFGKSGEGYIRCSYATSFEEIEQALLKIKKFVKSI